MTEDGLELTILPHLLSAGITDLQEHTKLLEACKFRSVGIAVFSHQGKDETGQHDLWGPPVSSLVPILLWFWNLKCIFNFPQMKSQQRESQAPFLAPEIIYIKQKPSKSLKTAPAQFPNVWNCPSVPPLAISIQQPSAFSPKTALVLALGAIALHLKETKAHTSIASWCWDPFTLQSPLAVFTNLHPSPS